MNLDGQRLLRKDQLQQQRRVWRIHVTTLKPEFSDCDAIVIYLAPGPEVSTSPGFTHDLHAGMFDRHDLLLVRAAQIWPMAVSCSSGSTGMAPPEITTGSSSKSPSSASPVRGKVDHTHPATRSAACHL